MENFEPNFSEETVVLNEEQPSVEPSFGDYGTPEFAAEVAEEKKPNKVLGIISLICGIISVPSLCCCGCGNWLFAIAAIILAIVDKSKNGKMTGMAKAGLIIAIVGLVFGLVFLIFNLVINGAGFLGGMMEGMNSSMYSDSYYY